MALPNDKIATMAQELRVALSNKGIFTPDEIMQLVVASMPFIIEEAKFGA